MTKYIFVTGGVTSSLGKGVTTASIGRLMRAKGLSVNVKKFDPYLNIDPGTLSPAQHGEVFVTEDGGESDLDLGHYERFVDIKLTKNSDITTGKIYMAILDAERHGNYLGNTVQVIPHVTDEIKRRIVEGNDNVDICVIEIGGTVGDIESLPFLEAIRQEKIDLGADNVLYVHVTLVPTVVSEVKTKPTQHSVKELRSIGIQPDILICRTNSFGSLTDDMKRKLALFCNVDINAIFENHNLATIYELPCRLREQSLDTVVCKKLRLPDYDSNLGVWTDIGLRIRSLIPSNKIIGIIGQFAELPDAYISLSEAVKHACLAIEKEVKIDLISEQEISSWGDAHEVLDYLDGIIIAGDCSEDKLKGKIMAATWALNRKLPCLGINTGMHAMISSIIGQTVIEEMGSTRLGNQQCYLVPHSKVGHIYGTTDITERHRHIGMVTKDHFPVNSDLMISGMSHNLEIVEAVEGTKHPWFIGVQYHPEFQSRPDKPHLLIESFVKEVVEHRRGIE